MKTFEIIAALKNGYRTNAEVCGKGRWICITNPAGGKKKDRIVWTFLGDRAEAHYEVFCGTAGYHMREWGIRIANFDTKGLSVNEIAYRMFDATDRLLGSFDNGRRDR